MTNETTSGAAPTAGLREALDEAWKLLDIAYSAHQKLGFEGQGARGLPHETRMFAAEFSKPEEPKTPEHTILSGTGRYQKWREQTKAALAAPTPSPAPVAGLPPSGVDGLQPTPENIRYILRYGGRCRDCADRNGVCDNGMPCDPRQCEAVIKHTLAAISYGSTHGFYPPLSVSVEAWQPNGYLLRKAGANDDYYWVSPASYAHVEERFREFYKPCFVAPPASGEGR